MDAIPASRLRIACDRPVRPEGTYVLYWMIAFRRPHHNFSLDRAIGWAKELQRPLLIFEPLRSGYRWASDRLHGFVLQGMADNAACFAARQITYYPYVEPALDAGKGLLLALAKEACLVVSDDYPSFFVPNMLRSVEKKLTTRLELVDSNGLLPIHTPTKSFPTAYAFRRYLQKELPNHLLKMPAARPLHSNVGLTGAKVSPSILKRWPMADAALLRADSTALGKLPIDHSVTAAAFSGGFHAGTKQGKQFVAEKLSRYADERNHPDADASSGISPYLHYGHLSVHDLFSQIVQRDSWDITELSESTAGKREGYWNMSREAEAFLDEVITWREIGFNMNVQHPQSYDKYESLPAWAQATLQEHSGDSRPALYSAEEFETAQTTDKVWNAAQNQIVRQGKMQNYMRMLWGKKILHWSKTPQQALSTMIHLNNKYGVDGRDPNSYSGMFWVFGRYDRPWPERQIFGKVRYMTSESTLRKLKMKQYMQEFSS
jgi:deoxyribodipyrimidine photo-lyase